MRIIRKLVILMLLCFVFSSQVQAVEEITNKVYFSRAGTKIISGVANVATGWMELPKNIILWGQRDKNVAIGTAEGLLWGIFILPVALEMVYWILPLFGSQPIQRLIRYSFGMISRKTLTILGGAWLSDRLFRFHAICLIGCFVV
ncbi:hypothetical protein [Nitrosomonas sp.]|uniref:hypothetical protein n=1 Tax=Nitrosomonas sp. TaxID=42353 RepID=UPI0025F13DF2|nr:hypothetical protein [Nitrosomonas sp.]